MQIELLDASKSNNIVHAFLWEKFKVLLIKQKLKWCKALKMSSNFIGEQFTLTTIFQVRKQN